MSLPASERPESESLREMIREVLREVVPRTMTSTAARAAEPVTLATDDDVAAFARRIASAPADVREAIVSGATVFLLAPGPVGTSAATAAQPTSSVRIESGAVTERHVRDAESAGASIILGRKAVLTPLARDRARAAHVEITRER